MCKGYGDTICGNVHFVAMSCVLDNYCTAFHHTTKVKNNECDDTDGFGQFCVDAENKGSESDKEVYSRSVVIYIRLQKDHNKPIGQVAGVARSRNYIEDMS